MQIGLNENAHAFKHVHFFLKNPMIAILWYVNIFAINSQTYKNVFKQSDRKRHEFFLWIVEDDLYR